MKSVLSLAAAVCLAFVCVVGVRGESPELPDPGIKIPVDVDGDGKATFGDQYALNLWLSQGGSLKAALSASESVGEHLDMSAFFASLSGGGGVAMMVASGGEIERLPTETTDDAEPDGESRHGRITADGDYVVMASKATNFVNDTTNAVFRIYRVDRDAGDTLIVSLNDDEDATETGFCDEPTVSDDGTKVAFWTNQALVDEVNGGSSNNGKEDVYLATLDALFEPTVISRASGTSYAANQDSQLPSISGDGDWIAYTSEATNIDTQHSTFGEHQVYLADLASLDSDLESIEPGTSTGFEEGAWTGAPDHDAIDAAVVDDGELIVFFSEHAVFEDYFDGQIWLRDLTAGTGNNTWLLSGCNKDETTGDDDSSGASISSGAEKVVFSSLASNIGDDGTASVEDVFSVEIDLEDIEDERCMPIEKLSISEDDDEGDDDSYLPVISADGTLVAFASTATNLLAGNTESGDDEDVFVRKDGTHPQLGCVSVTYQYGEGDGNSTSPDITDDGSVVVFESTSENLISSDSNELRDVFARSGLEYDLRFKRGDANGDDSVNMADVTYISNWLFSSGSAPPCTDAADTNDDGSTNITDVTYLANALFSGGPQPPYPGTSSCGHDPTLDELECDSTSTNCSG